MHCTHHCVCVCCVYRQWCAKLFLWKTNRTRYLSRNLLHNPSLIIHTHKFHADRVIDNICPHSNDCCSIVSFRFVLFVEWWWCRNRWHIINIVICVNLQIKMCKNGIFSIPPLIDLCGVFLFCFVSFVFFVCFICCYEATIKMTYVVVECIKLTLCCLLARFRFAWLTVLCCAVSQLTERKSQIDGTLK